MEIRENWNIKLTFNEFDYRDDYDNNHYYNNFGIGDCNFLDGSGFGDGYGYGTGNGNGVGEGILTKYSYWVHN